MAVIATGFFDGVHKGHRLVIANLVDEAHRRGEKSIVITFWPHPRVVLQDDALNLSLLNTPDEKKCMIEGLGVDEVVQLPFTREFSNMGTEDYLRDIVVGRFGGTAILLGYDNRIGHDLLTPSQTASIAASLGLDVLHTDEVSSVGIAVSSTRIRSALRAGEVDVAAEYLGYNYSLSGEVVHGKKLGRTIGYPTANIRPGESMKLVPAGGVYLSGVQIGDRFFHGMTNVGPVIETHIFGFDEDIYGRQVRVSFLRRVREEKKFESLEELKNQLVQDEQYCKNLLSLRR